MKLSMFSVVHERGDTAPLLDDPLIHCQAARQLVLAYVSRTALMDYFRVPGDKRITLQQWNLVVDRNLEAFKRIIEGKFEHDEWEVEKDWAKAIPACLSRWRTCSAAANNSRPKGAIFAKTRITPAERHTSARTCSKSLGPHP